MNRNRVVVGVLAFLCCTALYAADWEEKEALSETIKANDLCEATVHPPGEVISGGQVMGCDWGWTMISYPSWRSLYPEEPARQHGVRFEGEWIPRKKEGGGQGTLRIYDWGLTVTNSIRCDWLKNSIVPRDHEPFSPNFLGTELIPKSCPVVKGSNFSSLYETVRLGHDAQGNDLFGKFTAEPLAFTPMGVLPAPTNKLRGGACPHCKGDVCQYEILVEERSIRPTWRTWIELVEWTEKNESKRSDTLKAGHT